MASVTCPECRRELSPPVPRCPQCGAPLPVPGGPVVLVPTSLPEVGAVLWTGGPMQRGSLVYYALLVLLTPVLFYVTIPLFIYRQRFVRSTVYRITTEAVTITSGVWWRSTTTIDLLGIGEIVVVKSWLPSRSGCGNVVLMVDVADSDTWQALNDVPAAEQVRQLLQYLADARLLRGAVVVPAEG